MLDCHEETYLGNIISSKGTLDATIKARKLKGYTYTSEIRALLSDMHRHRHRRVEDGLILRDVIFINGILCNSEAWHKISEKNIDDFEVKDRMLMIFILGAHDIYIGCSFKGSD